MDRDPDLDLDLDLDLTAAQTVATGAEPEGVLVGRRRWQQARVQVRGQTGAVSDLGSDLGLDLYLDLTDLGLDPTDVAVVDTAVRRGRGGRRERGRWAALTWAWTWAWAWAQAWVGTWAAAVRMARRPKWRGFAIERRVGAGAPVQRPAANALALV